jgi:hypothetical protein
MTVTEQQLKAELQTGKRRTINSRFLKSRLDKNT